MTRRLISFLIVLTVLLSTVVAFSGGVEAVERKPIKRTIAIVYDNSGSMFYAYPQSWCQATYAVEVFAAMMNPGDKLMIYPMQTLNGGKYSDESPLIIEGGGDLSPIRKIQTDDDSDTPIETIERAREGLRGETADEKWLIILTDGDVFYRNKKPIDDTPGTSTKEELEKEIQIAVNNDLNVIYLGIGQNLDKPIVNSPKYFSDKASTGSEVTEKLSEMCNIIFGRDELPSANVNGSTVTFDVSMKKLIVFVQGEGIENVDLKDSSGTPANRGFDFPARYNEEGNAKLTSWSIDKSLQGQLVFFENCKAGTYNLSYSGTPSSIKVYYEPDVDLEASFYRLSEGGQYVKVDPNKDAIFPGDYMFKLVMKDVDGNETTSNLLGTPQFKTIYRINGKEYTSDSAETRFQVESGDEIGECDFEVTYLNDYTIKRNSAIDFGWKNPIPVILHLVETNCVDSGQSSYGLSEFEGNAKMTFTYSVDGVPLSGDELERVTPEFIIDGLKADYERTDTGFDVKLGLLKPMTETECREYQVVASGRYIDENGKESVVVNPAVVPFSIVNDGYEIALSLEAPQDYFVRSKLKEGDALIAHLTKNGEAMTAEEIEQIELTVDTGGVPYELEKDPENSAIKIKLKDSDSFENGKYDVKCTASIKNNVGAVVSSEDQKTVEIRAYPKWVRYVIALGIIALLAALIAFYMTRKVLPKSIRIDMSQNPVVTKGTKKFGEPVIAPFKGKKRGVLRISFPPNPYLSDGFSFNLVAVDKRHVKSSRRKAMITTGFAGSMYARSVTIGGGQFKKDKNSQKFLNVAGEEQLNETIANGDYVQMTTTDRNGQTFHLKCTLLFK